MFLRRRCTILEKIFICSLIALHLTLILPLSEVFPLPKTITRSEAYADEPPNQPPIIEPIPAIVKDEGETIVLQPVAYDPEGGPVTLSYGAPFDENGAWTIPYNYTDSSQTNPLTAQVTATDNGGLQSTINVDITVNNVNVIPTVNITSSSYSIDPDTTPTFTLYIDANDEDGDSLTYELTEGARTIPVPPNNEVIENTPLPGSYQYTITVTDSALETAIASCYVEVIDTTEEMDDVSPISGDFNGDGLTDIGTWNRTTDVLSVALSEGTTFNNVRTWSGIFDVSNYATDYTNPITGDFNGDGLTDIALYDRGELVLADDSSNPAPEGAKWKFAFSNGEDFIYDSLWEINGFGGGHSTPLTGDFNGDGITDIGYSFSPDDYYFDSSAASTGYFCIKLAEEDRTGFKDTAIIHQTNLENFSAYSGDFNGDGLSDILAFNKDDGEWRVFLSQDTTSAQLIDLMQDVGTTSQTQYQLNGQDWIIALDDESSRTKDGDFGSYFQVGAGGQTQALIHTQFDFLNQNKIIQFQLKALGYGQAINSSLHQAYLYVDLYYGGAWHEEVYADSGTGGSSYTTYVGDDMCPITIAGAGNEVSKIKVRLYGQGTSNDGSAAVARIYDAHAWLPEDAELFTNSLPAFTEGESWILSGFGQDMDAVITDYNHDGKTDIGYFDAGTGEWVYAVSDGTQFIETTSTGWSYYETDGGSSTYYSPSEHSLTCDNDWDTKIENTGSTDSRIVTQFNFSSATDITSVAFKSYGVGWANPPGGIGSAHLYVDLWYSNQWSRIYTESVGVNSAVGDENSSITVNGNWSGVEKIKLEVYAHGSSLYGSGTQTRTYEVQAFTTLPDGTQINVVEGPSWPNGFGEGTDILPYGGDFNGDGIGDAAIFRKEEHGVLNKWVIQLHNSQQPDFLISVDNGIGGTTDIEYGVSTQFDNTGGDGNPDNDLPFPVHVVEKVTKTDGMGHSYDINYEYKDGLFESDSREFRGFKYVKAIDYEGTVKETWFNQDDIYKGRPQEERVSDVYGRTYSSTLYEWDSTIIHGGSVTFPYLVSKTSTLYDVEGGTSRDVRIEYSEHDVYGNVGRIDELGFVDDTTDDRYTLIEYEYDIENYIVGKPKHTTVKKGIVTVSETWHRYDGFGSLKEEEKWLNTGPNPITKFKYDYDVNPNQHFGNVVEVEDALSHKTTTAYDPLYEYAFPTTVTNALTHTQTFTYDYKTGQILTSIDPNGQLTQTIYDGFGRVLKIIGPNDSVESPGIEYSYDLLSRPAKITTVTKTDDNGTPADDTDDIEATSYAFIDGLGRTIEIKTEAEDGDLGPRQIISGIAEYDSRGQVKEKYLPYYVPYSEDYVTPTYAQAKITYTYDAIGRVVQTLTPDNVVSYVQYEGWTVRTIDGNGNMLKSEKDAYGRLVKVFEYNGAEEYITQYQYDTLGNLTTTIDSQNNTTTIIYDTLGRKISMDDPDMGQWGYAYDLVGNLVSQTDAKGQTIEFRYDDINRLRKKKVNGQTIVDYLYDRYGDNDTSFRTGRLRRVNDSSGSTKFFYDELGREIETQKELDGTWYTIERTYDSLDRLKTVKYPDYSIVTYTYNKAGGIEKVGKPQDDDFYVVNIDYNANGQMTLVEYGNDTYTTYNYNPYTLRLEHLVTQAPAAIIQDLTYAFDSIGNVLSITDTSDTGTNTQSFQYDAINRLISATGAGYQTINYAYDSIGNMLQKGDITMEYGITAGPHAVTSYTKNDTPYTITYDANGNMESKGYPGGAKTFTYDIENRLIETTAPKEEYLSDYTINLNAGWNFISLPIIPVPTSDIATILQSSGITKAEVARYNAETQSWEHFAYESGYDLSEFCDFANFEYGKGYEIYVETTCTLTVSGDMPITPRALELYNGWNLIAAPTTTSIDADEALNNVVYNSVYERQDGAYVPVTTLESGKAYFVSVSTAQTWNIPQEQVPITYVYDGDGGRVKRITEDETVTYIGSAYETSLRAGGEAISIKKHIFMGSTRICTVEYDDVESPTYDHYYFHQDHIGSSNVITDENGQIAKLVEYTPYGLTARDDPDYNYDTDCLYTGQLFDNGLYFFESRFYDPQLGRFITADTIVPYPSDPQSFNRYAYARNNPIRYIDPSGHSWKSFFRALIGGIVAGAILALTGGAGAPFIIASIAAGIAGGATTGALTGGWQGALIGGGIGAIMGAGVGQWGAAFGIGAAALGGGYAYATGGWEGLGNFGSGLAGGVVGGAIGYTAGSAFTNSYSSASPAGGNTNDPATGAEIQQAERAAVDIQGTTDALSEEVGTLQAGRIAPKVIVENVTQPAKNYGPQSGKILGGIGLKAASDIRMKVPYNGRITFIPKGIAARAGNALGVAAKWFGRFFAAARLGKHAGTLVGNYESGGGLLLATHDAALTASDAMGLVGAATPLRWLPAGAEAVDMASEYWGTRIFNRIYGVE